MSDLVPITPKVRAAVFKAWGHLCAYCKTNPTEQVDHIFPKAKGGEDRLENYAAACARCNLMKSDGILGEGFLEIMRLKAANKAPKITASLVPKKPKPAPSKKAPKRQLGSSARRANEAVRVVDIPWTPEDMRKFLELDEKYGEAAYENCRKFTIRLKDVEGVDKSFMELPIPRYIARNASKSYLHEATYLISEETLSVTYTDDLALAIRYALALRTQAFIFIQPDVRVPSGVLPDIEDCAPVSGSIYRTRPWLIEIPQDDAENLKEAA